MGVGGIGGGVGGGVWGRGHKSELDLKDSGDREWLSGPEQRSRGSVIKFLKGATCDVLTRLFP